MGRLVPSMVYWPIIGSPGAGKLAGNVPLNEPSGLVIAYVPERRYGGAFS